MRSRRLPRAFYVRPALTVAKDLLGKLLGRVIEKPINRNSHGRENSCLLPDGRYGLVGKIVETEAYIGPRDRASHAFGGKITQRNRAEWLIGGHVYIYLVYGMYWQFNISTGQEGVPECVLIRALEPVLGNPKSQFPNPKQIPNSKFQISKQLFRMANGPGKLCRWMKFDKSFYGEDLVKSPRLWVENQGVRVPRPQIMAGPRIGIDYAGPYWARRPWRFWIKNNPAVSRG